MLTGKGLFIWRAEQVLSHMRMDAVAAALTAQAAGIEHVIVKVADGENPYPIPRVDTSGRQEQATRQLVQACQTAGIAVWGFSFVYGDDVDPLEQARIFARRARDFQLKGLVINAEGSWKNEFGADNARALVTGLRREMGDSMPFALSSFRYPSFHTQFPFAAFMEACEVAMPQVYWAAFNGAEGDAVENLRRSHQEYRQRFPTRLFVPTGAAYGEKQPDDSYWTSTPRQITRFLQECQARQFPAANFWSWEHAIRDPANERMPGTELWDAIADFQYSAPGDDEPDDGESGDGDATIIVDETETPIPVIDIAVNGNGYHDGIHARQPNATFFSFTRGDMPIKYARSLSTPASVWAAWVPQDLNDQEYEILAWIPAEHATTRQARYHIHGVRQKDSPVVVEVNQSQFADTWASLGTFRFDLTRSHSGHVQLTNFTGEDNREVAFATLRWQPAGVAASAGERLADGFDPPVGTMSERRSNKIWPGEWFDVTGYDVLYTIRREPVGHNQWRDVKAFHTGADLNLPRNLDRRAPLFAVASGQVTFAGFMTAWGNIIVIRHDPLWPEAPPVYSRYAHMFSIDVRAGDRVERGERIGLIGEGDPDKPFAAHLHFDISPTTILEEKPSHWPALKRDEVHQHYVDPRRFIEEHRPPQE